MLALLLALVNVAGILPKGATVVETKLLPKAIKTDRMLVLWVLAPRKHCQSDWRDLWTTMCLDSTRGCYYEAVTRVSLLDTREGVLINTLSIADPDTGKDSFDVPYQVGHGGPYRIRERFGRPTLLALRDYNGDGVAAEFALFDALTCSDLLTTLIGYVSEKDQVIQYPIHATFEAFDHQVRVLTTSWSENLFATNPLEPGHWRFSGDNPDSYSNPAGHIHLETEVWYRPGTQTFEELTVKTERD